MPSETKFEYDDLLLSSCARSQLAAFIEGNENHENGNDEACYLLHQQHASHFGNPKPSAAKKSSRTYHLDDRLKSFVKNVLLVYGHNSDRQQLHRLALNRFADGQIPKYLDPSSGGNEWESSFDWDSIEKELDLSPLGYSVDDDDDDDDDDGFENQEISPNLTIGKGGLGNLYHRRKRKEPTPVRESVAEKLKFPDREDHFFGVPLLRDPNFDGELLKVKPRHSMEKALESGEFEKTDRFGKYLNWATSNNPDGVAIVKNAFDQGECGSCWAFAAAGSLEASVSRTQAHEAFNEYLEQASLRRHQEKPMDVLQSEAVDFAMSVEKATFQMANLSIQELISCDTAADQGCIGGNPLLAFYFIHRYGLTSWSQYPYVGDEDFCHKKWVSRPVAKVKSWGIISPNHEFHMQLALRYIGPIAVGVNGAERSFLAYQDGIYDKSYCRQGANHALLITGYGQEETPDGRIVKYWIARNSWGRNWGENGYVRVRRNGGFKGEKGVCGIARSPSVALGGVLLANRHRLAPYHTPKTSQFDSEHMSTSPKESLCARLRLDCQGFLDIFESHKAIMLGSIAIACAVFLAVWPLTFQCRRRRQRRRRAQELRESLRLESGRPDFETPPSPPAAPSFESDPLLGNRSLVVYGD